MPTYLLGLDNGGTATKAALYDLSGRELGVAGTATRMLARRPGFAERDMEEMWQANCRVIRELLDKTGVAPEAIAGVAICGHGKGLYLWGKDGRPARDGIISTDNRAYEYPARWRADGTEERAFALSCQHMLSCQPPALLNWLADHEPDTLRNVRWVFGCKDYVRFRLTGEARSEVTDASGAHLLNLRTRGYDDELLSLYSIGGLRAALPPLCESTELCGTVSEEAARQCGLRAGTPVAGGAFDIDACAIAADVLDERRVCMIAGTWSINEYPRSAPVTDGSVLMNSLFCLPGLYLIEESSPTSAGNNEWFANALLPEVRQEAEKQGRGVYDVMGEWVSSVPPERFVPVFLPFLLGSNVHPNARGSFVGLGANHTRADMVRAVFEGVVFSHRCHLDKLLRTRSQPPECLRLAGGAARSRVWTQIFADALGFPVETVRVNETGALGCAMIAATAIGAYPSLQEAAKSMCPMGERVMPDASRKPLYDERYALYQKAVTCLDPLWDDMQRLIEKEGC